MPDASQRWGLAMYDMNVGGLQSVGMILDTGSTYINVPTFDIQRTLIHV